MKELTPVQGRVLELLKRYIAQNYWPPTRREIRDLCGWKSDNAAEEHLRALARKGMIELLPGVSRGIRIIPDKPTTCPHCHQVLTRVLS